MMEAAHPRRPTGAALGYRELLARSYNRLIPRSARVLEVGCGAGELLARLDAKDVTGIDLSADFVRMAAERVPHGRFLRGNGEALADLGVFDVVILSDTLNGAADAQALLEGLLKVSKAETRLILNIQSNLWRPMMAAARELRLGCDDSLSNWLSTGDTRGLLALAGWEPIRPEHRLLFPLRLPGVEIVFNRWLAPLLSPLCLTVFIVARPRPERPEGRRAAVSVVVPARNEAGNLRSLIERLPRMGSETEIIFVEGHSKDGTWDEILRLREEFPQWKIKALKQTGTGKGNAVWEAFSQASGDVLMILDADLSTPPEELPRFYDALVRGRAELANGCRLVYPMEGGAMPFLNLCANKAFGLAFSWLLGQPVKDTLCGTKALFRSQYELIAANRSYFGELDPFGDFDLLFGAGKLNLKIADVPVHYRQRTYGKTNIHRWSHGWLLLKMLGVAARKLKFVS